MFACQEFTQQLQSRLKNDSRHRGSPREEDLAEAIVEEIMQAKKKLKYCCNFYRLLLSVSINVLVSFLDMMVYAGDSVYNQFERHRWLDALCDM